MRKLLKTFLYLILILNLSCKQKESDKSNIIFDTITPFNHQIRLIKNDSNKIDVELSIKSGKKGLKITNVNFDVSKEKLPHRIFDLNHFVGFRNQCGYNCWSVDFYNLKRKSKPLTVYDVLQAQSKKDLIVYFNSEENQIEKVNLVNNEFEIVILNLLTRERQFIKLENIYVTQNLMDNIFSVKFENGFLSLQWLSQEKGPENLITKRKKVRINI